MAGVTCLLSISCQSSHNVSNFSYRAPLDVTGTIGSALSSPEAHIPREAHACFLSWQAEHDNLVDALEQGRLCLWESHRRTTGHLQNLISCLPSHKSKILTCYIKLYQNLLEEAELGTPPRVMVRKYKALKDAVTGIVLS